MNDAPTSALLFALLFHDSGKNAEGRGHVEASAQLAEQAMARIQTPQRERDTVRFLILRHLELSAAMQARDLSDPKVVHEVYERLDTVRAQGITLLIVEQNVSALELANEVHVLSNGSVVSSGPPEQYRDTDVLAAAYLGSTS